MKKNLLLFISLILFVLTPLQAKEAVFSNELYDISLVYNESANPGDAVFIRILFSANEKKLRNKDFNVSASATLFLNDKNLISSSFFLVPVNSSKTKKTLLCGLPLSSWWTNDNYHLTVTYSFDGGKQMEFSLPFSIDNKTFNSETIPLNESNTAIKTDTSPERINQIEKLNAILATTNADDVYQTTPFTPPTTSTRRTSYFADRRVYAYVNGKSSTSLHYGTDYGIPTGTPVTCCAAGKVVMAENRISTGWSVVVEHLPGLYSLYYHMSVLSVKEGDIVKAGDKLGLSGATGLATGPHLHWEMRLNMCAVNPDFFTKDFAFTSPLEH